MRADASEQFVGKLAIALILWLGYKGIQKFKNRKTKRVQTEKGEPSK